MSTAMEDSQPHLVMVPSPGLGHLIPLVEFAKRIAAVHRFSVTVAIPSGTPPSKHHLSVLSSLPSAVKPLFLPLVSFLDLPKRTKSETLISLSVTRSLPFLRDLCKSLAGKTHLAALVADHFAADAFDVALEFNLPRYLFFPPSAMSLAFALHLPDLDRTVAGEFRDHPDPIRIPGCIPIHGRELLVPAQDREDDAYKLLLRNYKRFRLADGIFLNSFPELEPETVKSLLREQQPPVYPIGPIVRTEFAEIEEQRADCLEWLDEQPNGSVLFVSFGSGDTLSSDQIKELALGLEMSGHRFLWVVKTPIDKSENENPPSEFLPEGFLNRVKNRGMVVSDWAPQIGVLSHGATGGFLTHCGWNSILESVVNGIPMIAWPLWGEQRMNAHLLTEDLKVALRMKNNDRSGIVEKEEIAEMVKSLMEGEDGKMIREKMKNLKIAGERNLEEDGCSSKAISQLALKWKNTIIYN